MSGSYSILRAIGSKAKNSLALVGVGTTIYAASELKQYNDTYFTKDPKTDKKILMLPFHRMKIVEQKKGKMTLSSIMSKFGAGASDGDGVMEVEIRELIDVIYAAAEDPTIVAIHGNFGNGSGLQCGGYAHAEEIRNAIRVFNESHRRHFEPKDITKNKNGDNEDEGDKVVCERATRKVSYAYADAFDNPDQKQYFIASAFSKIQMQPRGDLNLFGVSMSHFFLSDAFRKYGIKAHVFKHGQYKNAPNSFSETGYTNSHYENTKSILDSINQTIYSSISQSRTLPSVFDKSVWENIHNYGTMSAENAQEIKLVDHLPKVNPIFDLIQMNKDENEKGETKLRDKWASLLADSKFEARNQISLKEYSEILHSKKKWIKKKCELYKKALYAVSRSTASESLLGVLGCQAPYFFWEKDEVEQILSKFTKDKIAVIHVTGAIGNKSAASVSKALKEVKKDDNIKCLVLRIDSPGGGVTASETILEECKDTDLPVVCSFSNYAASGGYYISAFSEKIFAQRTTITGSIGVFGIKFDATEAANRHGLNFDSVAAGKHAGTFSFVQPLNHDMKINLWRNMDRIYTYFKTLVSDGRQISMAEVEGIAQGRVWSGHQAKEKKLVDEFGGIHRAIDYAISKHTSGGLVDVEVFPKPKTFFSFFDKENTTLSDDNFVQLILNCFLDGSVPKIVSPCSTVLCMDEMSTIQTIMQEAS